MSEGHEPFLRAIEAAPDDPLPKLLFADFLGEHGDARAAGLRWLVDQGKRPARDTQYGSWDWWSRPPAEPDYYDGAESVAFAVLPPNLFRRLKGFRRIFTRYDKLDVIFTAFIHFALIVDALR